MKTKLLLSTIMMFAFAVYAHAYTVTVNVPTETGMCYLAGNFNGWSPSATKMTKVSDGVFTAEINVTQDLDFKVCAGPSWDYEQIDPADNFQFSLEENPTSVEITVVAFKAYPQELEIVVWVPLEVKECYVTGSFHNWAGAVESTKMKFEGIEDEGNVYSITILGVPATLELKFIAGPSWDYEQTADNLKYSESDPVGTFVVNSFKAIFDPDKTGNITINATVPEGTKQVWIQGSFPNASWNWDNPKEMTKNEDGTFTYTTGLLMSLEYRLYNSPDWGHPEVGEADPTADLPNRQVTYDPDNSTINITVWGWKVVIDGVNKVYDDYFTIRTSGNNLIIDGAQSKVSIFDISGKIIENGMVNGVYTSKTLNKGLYIVNVDGYARKVLVK